MQASQAATARNSANAAWQPWQTAYPIMWTKTAETILAKERRALQRLQDLTGCQPAESEY